MTTRGVYWHDTVYIKVHVHITHTHTLGFGVKKYDCIMVFIVTSLEN